MLVPTLAMLTDLLMPVWMVREAPMPALPLPLTNGVITCVMLCLVMRLMLMDRLPLLLLLMLLLTLTVRVDVVVVLVWL